MQESTLVDWLNDLANPGHHSVWLDVFPERRLCVEIPSNGLGKDGFHVLVAPVGIGHPVQLSRHGTLERTERKQGSEANLLPTSQNIKI